jgi:hypothetical protein
VIENIGDPGVTRTRNILLRRQVLYPVELRGRMMWHSLSEIISIGLKFERARGSGGHHIVQPFGLGISNSSFLRGEVQAQLLLYVGGADPAHQGIGAFAGLRLKRQSPTFGLALTGLGGGFGGLKDTDGHARLKLQKVNSIVHKGFIAPPISWVHSG